MPARHLGAGPRLAEDDELPRVEIELSSNSSGASRNAIKVGSATNMEAR